MVIRSVMCGPPITQSYHLGQFHTIKSNTEIDHKEVYVHAVVPEGTRILSLQYKGYHRYLDTAQTTLSRENRAKSALPLSIRRVVEVFGFLLGHLVF